MFEQRAPPATLSIQSKNLQLILGPWQIPRAGLLSVRVHTHSMAVPGPVNVQSVPTYKLTPPRNPHVQFNWKVACVGSSLSSEPSP